MQSRLSPSDMILYQGDALVLPCYQDIMRTGRYARFLQKVLDNAGTQLIDELSVVGELEMFHVHLTKGYNLPSRYLIFYACLDDEPEFALTSLNWHEVWSNVVTLARLYHLKKLGIKLPVALTPAQPNLLFRVRSAFRQKSIDSDAITILNTVMKSDKEEEHLDVSLFL